MSYVLNLQSVWQFYCAYLFNLLQFLIADLNIFILFRFVRGESGLIRNNSVNGAIIDMPAILARFGHYFGKVTFAHCTVRNQFCCLCRIRKYGFGRVWIFVHNRMACAKMPSIAVTALFLSLLLPVMTIRFRIRGRFLFLRARILPV
jgi:hypothetical protein